MLSTWESFPCNQWWKWRQNYEIAVSMLKKYWIKYLGRWENEYCVHADITVSKWAQVSTSTMLINIDVVRGKPISHGSEFNTINKTDTVRKYTIMIYIASVIKLNLSSWYEYIDGMQGSAFMTSPNRNIFRVTGHLYEVFSGRWWIPRTKSSDAELWCFLWSSPEWTLGQQSWGW